MEIVLGLLFAVALSMVCAMMMEIAESFIKDYRRDAEASRSKAVVEETESSAEETQEEELRKLGFVSERCVVVDESVGEAATTTTTTTALMEEAFRRVEEAIGVADFDEFGDRLEERLESMEEDFDCDYGYDDYDDDDSVFGDLSELESEPVEENLDDDDGDDDVVLGDRLKQQSEPEPLEEDFDDDDHDHDDDDEEEEEEEVRRSDESLSVVVAEEKFVDEKAETLVFNDISLEVVTIDEVIDERIAKKGEHVDVVEPSEEMSSEIRATCDERIAKNEEHVDIVEPSEEMSSEIRATSDGRIVRKDEHVDVVEPSEEMSSEIRATSDVRIAKNDEHVDVVEPSEEMSSEIRATSDERIAKKDHVDVVEPGEEMSSEIRATSDERIAKKDEHVDVVEPSEEMSSEIGATSDERIAKKDEYVDVVEPSEEASSEIRATSDERIVEPSEEKSSEIRAGEEMSSEIREKEVEIVEKEGLLDDENEDDWEGIERSGIEKRFYAAAKFIEDNSDCLSKLGTNVKMQLYALQKVSIEGPCYKPSPMALMVAARAKWNAWQKLGNMSPEVAMEQYISILSEGIPEWEGEKSDVNCVPDKINASPEIGESGTQVHGNYPRIDESQTTFEGVDDAIEGVKNL